MSAAEVVKKKGRPKKTVAETIALIDEPILLKARKPRVSRKSTTTSPNAQSKLTKDVASLGPQKKNEPLPSSPRAVKEPKSRPMKSVAAETAILASRQVKAPSTRPEPSLILKQATAFLGSQKDESPSMPSDPVIVEPQTRPREFKPAGTLPSVRVFEATKVSTSSASSQSKSTLFLAEFFTQPPLAEQPAWSRPKTKEAATTPTLSSIPPEATIGPDIAMPGRLNTSSPLSTSPPPLKPQPSDRGPSATANQVLQKPVSSGEAGLEPSPGQSTKPKSKLTQSGAPARAVPTSASQAAMPTDSTPQRPTPTSALPPKPVQPASTRSNLAMPKLPPHTPQAPPRPKPTEMAYEELRRDPKFRALSRKYTALIVSIPILIATSYALYGRYTETAVQRTRVRDRGTSTINGGV